MATFPWDPKPEVNAAPPAPAPGPTLAPGLPLMPSQPAAAYAAALSPSQNTTALPPQSRPPPQMPQGHQYVKPESVNHGLSVKTEPGLPGSGGQNVAFQRALQNIQSQYGPRAEAVLNNYREIAPQQGSTSQQAMAPQQGTPQQAMSHQQYRQSLAASTAAAMHHRAQNSPQPNGSNGAPPSQVDGSSDSYEGVLIKREADGNPVEMGRVDIDDLIHNQIASRAKQMEGGGLMLPLREATKHRSLASQKKGGRTNQTDGPGIKDEDDEVDADAINSDLDDPDDKRADDDDEDEGNQTMLCMYDKVQRVKNKW